MLIVEQKARTSIADSRAASNARDDLLCMTFLLVVVDEKEKYKDKPIFREVQTINFLLLSNFGNYILFDPTGILSAARGCANGLLPPFWLPSLSRTYGTSFAPSAISLPSPSPKRVAIGATRAVSFC